MKHAGDNSCVEHSHRLITRQIRAMEVMKYKQHTHVTQTYAGDWTSREQKMTCCINLHFAILIQSLASWTSSVYHFVDDYRGWYKLYYEWA